MMCLMAKTLSSRASDWREGRRLRAFELKEQGCKQKEWTYPEVADSFRLRHRNLLYRLHCSLLILSRAQVA
jgi:hypothetical protein